MLDIHISEFHVLNKETSDLLAAFQDVDAPHVCEESLKIDSNLMELKDLLACIQIYIKALPRSERCEVSKKLCGLEESYKDLSYRWKELASVQQDKIPPEIKRKIIARTEKQRVAADKLDSAISIALESSQLAENMLGNLDTQKESLQRATRNAKTVEENMSTSDQIMKRLSKWWNALM